MPQRVADPPLRLQALFLQARNDSKELAWCARLLRRARSMVLRIGDFPNLLFCPVCNWDFKRELGDKYIQRALRARHTASILTQRGAALGFTLSRRKRKRILHQHVATTCWLRKLNVLDRLGNAIGDLCVWHACSGGPCHTPICANRKADHNGTREAGML